MTTSSLNSAQHVERIREILIGRDLRQVRGRMDRLEDRLQQGDVGDTPGLEALKESFAQLENDQLALKSEVQQLRELPSNEGAVSDRLDLDEMTAELNSRIDARFREMLSNIQSEILRWKGQLEEEVQNLCQSKVDRSELKDRFARIANAVMEANPPLDSEEGSLP